jgi:glycosyltransferase involved in cell wall biosynthesis
MRFLMLNWRDPRNPMSGGAERVTLGYLSALVKRGHEVFWFTYDFPGAKTGDSIEGVQIVRGGGFGSSILHARRWYRRQPPFDLVMDQHHGIPWFAPWWCRTRCVSNIHEVLGPIWNAFYRWPLNWIGRWQERWTHWLYRRVPFWTACPSTRDDLLVHGVRDITIIPYGVHTVALPQLDTKPLVTPLRLIVVSRLAPNKRVDHAIRALKCLEDRKVEASLTIVGAGEEAPRLRQLTLELNLTDRIVFTGPLPEAEKDRQLQQAHFLLHTSQREGWGLNVIEGNAMGTPAVVYPVAGLIESTLHDRTGLVAEAETPEALAASIVLSLQAPEKYQQYRHNAWERAKTFHWDVVLPQACDWLEKQARRPR